MTTIVRRSVVLQSNRKVQYNAGGAIVRTAVLTKRFGLSANVGIEPVRWVTWDPAPCHPFTIAPVVRILGLWHASQLTILERRNLGETTHLPSPIDPSLHPLSNLNLHLEVFPHLVLIILRESGRVACVTFAAAKEVLVRAGAPLPFPASANAAPVEPFRAVGEGVGPFPDDCPDV
jgi:hypothetical protein